LVDRNDVVACRGEFPPQSEQRLAQILARGLGIVIAPQQGGEALARFAVVRSHGEVGNDRPQSRAAVPDGEVLGIEGQRREPAEQPQIDEGLRPG